MANKCRNMCKISDHQGTAYQNHNEISSYLISSYPVRMATDKKTNKKKQMLSRIQRKKNFYTSTLIGI